MPPWIYLAGAFIAFTIVLGIAGVREGRRPKGLKPWVDSGK